MSPSPGPAPRDGAPPRSILYAAFFLSGAAALTLEVVWTRLLLLSLGATATAMGAVLAAFMAGMAAGSALARRPFLSRRDPVLAYGVLEAGVGVHALASPFLLRALETLPPAGQVALAILMLLPSTAAMGASLPILVRALSDPARRPEVEVGRLYATNTAGAVAGPVLSVFLFFPALGLAATLYLAAGLDLFVAAAVLASRHRFGRGATALADGPARGRPRAILLVALGVSGATAMIYEVAWSRTLSMVYGSSVYGVSILLSTFLLGIAAGSALAAAWLRRREEAASLTTVAWLLAGSAGLAFASLILARGLPFLFLNLYRSAPQQELSLFAIQFLVSAALMLLPTLCLGAMLPVAASASGEMAQDPAGAVSHLYAANLVGSAAGAMAASALLLAHFGVELSVRLASLGALVLASVLVFRAPRFSTAAAGVAAAAALFILGLDPSSARSVKSFGIYSEPRAYAEYDARALRELVDAHQLLYYRDGPTASVAVQQLDRFRLLKINGKTDASNGPGDVQTQLLLGHLPLLAAPAEDVAVIGWGSGMTAGAVLLHPVRRVDAFEIEPAVLAASRFFERENGRPLDDPRLELIVGDARSELRRRRAVYDLIISEPSNPWITGVSNLFTREFFELAASRLAPGGILCQWFHLYGMSEESTRSLLATFRSVFPHVVVFKDRDLILLGSQRPIRFSMPRMERLFADPGIKESLARAQVSYPSDVLSFLRLDEEGVREFSAGAPLNTDDNMLLELSAPRTLYRDEIDGIVTAMKRHPPVVLAQMSDYDSEAAVEVELATSLFTSGRKEEALALCRSALAREPSFAGWKLLGQILHGLGRMDPAREALEKALSLGGDPQEERFVRALLHSLRSPPDDP